MTTYDLYGFSSDDISEARNILENTLGILFEEHDSAYQGGDYFRCGTTAGENFILKRNVDPFDNDPAETNFPGFSILFYVNDTSRSVDLRETMVQKAKGFSLLRHEDI